MCGTFSQQPQETNTLSSETLGCPTGRVALGATWGGRPSCLCMSVRGSCGNSESHCGWGAGLSPPQFPNLVVHPKPPVKLLRDTETSGPHPAQVPTSKPQAVSNEMPPARQRAGNLLEGGPLPGDSRTAALCLPRPGHGEWAPQTSSTRLTEAFVRHKESQGSPPTCQIRVYIVKRSPGEWCIPPSGEKSTCGGSVLVG